MLDAYELPRSHETHSSKILKRARLCLPRRSPRAPLFSHPSPLTRGVREVSSPAALALPRCVRSGEMSESVELDVRRERAAKNQSLFREVTSGSASSPGRRRFRRSFASARMRRAISGCR
jgi:hypothetical protein